MAAAPQEWLDQSFALLERMEQERSGLADALADLEARIASLQDGVAAKTVHIEQLVDESVRLETSRTTLEARKAELTRREAELWDKLVVLQNEREFLKDAKGELERELAVTVKREQDVPRQQQATAAERKQLEREAASARDTRKDIARELARIEREMARMIRALEVATESDVEADEDDDVPTAGAREPGDGEGGTALRLVSPSKPSPSSTPRKSPPPPPPRRAAPPPPPPANPARLASASVVATGSGQTVVATSPVATASARLEPGPVATASAPRLEPSPVATASAPRLEPNPVVMASAPRLEPPRPSALAMARALAELEDREVPSPQRENVVVLRPEPPVPKPASVAAPSQAVDPVIDDDDDEPVVRSSSRVRRWLWYGIAVMWIAAGVMAYQVVTGRSLWSDARPGVRAMQASLASAVRGTALSGLVPASWATQTEATPQRPEDIDVARAGLGVSTPEARPASPIPVPDAAGPAAAPSEPAEPIALGAVVAESVAAALTPPQAEAASTDVAAPEAEPKNEATPAAAEAQLAVAAPVPPVAAPASDETPAASEPKPTVKPTKKPQVRATKPKKATKASPPPPPPPEPKRASSSSLKTPRLDKVKVSRSRDPLAGL